jgi:hypothetical protein
MKTLLYFLFVASSLTLACCKRQEVNNSLPISLFDTLKDQIVFVTDSSSKQTPDYNQNIARLNFLNLSSFVDSKDSFVVRFFIDQYRNREKKILQIKCDKISCSADQIHFKEDFDGKNFIRSGTVERKLKSTHNWRLIFDTLLINQLLTLTNSNDSSNCFNSTKDGTAYSIQLINYSGQRHYTYVNPEFYDSSCISGIYFDNIVKVFKTLENN